MENIRKLRIRIGKVYFSKENVSVFATMTSTTDNFCTENRSDTSILDPGAHLHATLCSDSSDFPQINSRTDCEKRPIAKRLQRIRWDQQQSVYRNDRRSEWRPLIYIEHSATNSNYLTRLVHALNSDLLNSEEPGRLKWNGCGGGAWRTSVIKLITNPSHRVAPQLDYKAITPIRMLPLLLFCCAVLSATATFVAAATGDTTAILCHYKCICVDNWTVCSSK